MLFIGLAPQGAALGVLNPSELGAFELGISNLSELDYLFELDIFSPFELGWFELDWSELDDLFELDRSELYWSALGKGTKDACKTARPGISDADLKATIQKVYLFMDW